MVAMPVTEQIPIRQDQQGRLRVGDTRVLFDLVVYAHLRHQTPESIVESYPSLSLEDVYLALGYYLRHRPEVDAYLREQEAEAEAFQRDYEAENPPAITREVLLARLRAKRNQSSG